MFTAAVEGMKVNTERHISQCIMKCSDHPWFPY